MAALRLESCSPRHSSYILRCVVEKSTAVTDRVSRSHCGITIDAHQCVSARASEAKLGVRLCEALGLYTLLDP